MKYPGSKNRHAKEILSLILSEREKFQWYVEPFVGGCNSFDKVELPKIGSDLNYYLIMMWRALQYGWVPPETITEQEYYDIRDNKEKHKPYLVGFVGVACSFAGKFFGGYARGNTAKGKPRNYCSESKRNVLKQIPNIRKAVFKYGDYRDLQIPDKAIVYCDPPYAGTTNSYVETIDSKRFWEWCNALVTQGHKVFVSEYAAPKEWNCIWAKEVLNTLDLNTGSKKGVEKLFTRNIKNGGLT